MYQPDTYYLPDTYYPQPAVVQPSPADVQPSPADVQPSPADVQPPTITIDGHTFIKYGKKDIVGYDIQHHLVESKMPAVACMSKCAKTSNCNAVMTHNTDCYLKNIPVDSLTKMTDSGGNFYVNKTRLL